MQEIEKSTINYKFFEKFNKIYKTLNNFFKKIILIKPF